MSSFDPIVVGFDWQPGEHAEVIQILTSSQFHSAGWRVAKWGVGIIGVGWLLIVIASVVMYGDLTPFFAGLPWAIFVGLWWLIFSRLIGPWTARRSQGLNADVHYPFTHRFDESGLRIDGFGSSVELRWEGMSQIREEDGFFMFYWNPKCAYFTPKRVMSIQDQNRLRVLAEEKLGADARVRPQITSGQGPDGTQRLDGRS